MKKGILGVLLFLLCLWMFLPGIFSIPTTDRDEALYAQATKQMVQTHDYSQVKFQNRPRHLKPPGIYWLQAMSVKAFSSADSTAMWPYRLVSTIGATIAVLTLFFGFASVVGVGTAAVAAAFLATSLLTVIEVHIANTDSMLLACMMLMQLGLFQAYRKWKAGETLPRTAFWLFWLAMSAGVLIKGITPLVGFLTLFGLLLIDRSWKFGKFIKPHWGILILIVLTLAWLIPVSIAGHSNFLWNMISGDVLPKLKGGQQSHGAWPGYYLVLLPLMLIPGSLVLPEIYKHLLTQFQKPVVRFCVAWVIPTWIFFACVPTKLPQYVWPLYPAILLMASQALLQNVQYRSKWRFLARTYHVIWLVYAIAFAILLVVYAHRISGVYNLASIIAAGILVLFALIAWALHRAGKPKQTIIFLILLGMCTFPVVFYRVLPFLTDMWMTQKIVVRLKSTDAMKLITSKQPLLATGYTEPSLVFAIGTHRVKFMNLGPMEKALADGKGTVALLLVKQWPEFKKLAAADHLKVTTLSEAYGFRYNGGHWQTVKIIDSKT